MMANDVPPFKAPSHKVALVWSGFITDPGVPLCAETTQDASEIAYYLTI